MTLYERLKRIPIPSDQDWNEIRAGIAYANSLQNGPERQHILRVLADDFERLVRWRIEARCEARRIVSEDRAVTS